LHSLWLNNLMKIESFLRNLLNEAGERLRKQYGKVKTISYKDGSVTNPVTNVDRDIEIFIKGQIRKNFPADMILAEESEMENENATRRWIVDPIDGTTNFAHGLPIFCISIGMEQDNDLIAGGVCDPIHNELFFARKGKGATLNGKRIHVSRTKRLDRSLLVTGFPYDIHEHPERSLPFFNAMIQRTQGLRRLGSAALDLCYVAMSRFDGFFEVSLSPWDTAAGALILKEAGGLLTDFSGSSYSIYKKEIVASNGLVHQEMIDVLQEVRTHA
jgi:myo-inositol-1(or 4)-monophosphatase